MDNPPVPASSDGGPDSAPDLSDADVDPDADADVVWTGGGGACEAGADCPQNETRWCIRGYCADQFCNSPADPACTSIGGTCRGEATPFDGGPATYTVCEYPH